MRKILTTLLITTILLSFVPIMKGAGNTNMGVVPSVTQITVGDSFNVTVWLDADESIDSWLIAPFSFHDPGKANITNGFVGSGWLDFADIGTFNNVTGTVNNTQGFEGDGHLDNTTACIYNITVNNIVGILYLNITAEAYSGGPDVLNNIQNATVTIHPDAPGAFVATGYNYTQINITSISAGTGSNTTVIRGSQTDYPESPTAGSEIYNGTGNSATHSGLTQGQTWYYSAWSYNSTHNLFSLTNTTTSGNTLSPYTWYFSSISPANGSTTADGTYSIPITVTVGNSLSEPFYWWINTTNSDTFSGSELNNTAVGGTMSGLSHSTLYWWNLTVSNASGATTNRSYYFTTGSGGGSAPDNPSNPSPINHAPSIPTNLGLFEVDVDDSDGDALNVTFYWSNGTLIDYDDPVAVPGTAQITPVLSLEYGTTYSWYAVADDGVLTARGPSTGYWDFTTDEIDITITKEWNLHDNGTMLVYLNTTNGGEINLTNVLVKETYDTNTIFLGSNPTNDSGDNTSWTIPFLNISGYSGHYYNITLWLDTKEQRTNGTTVSNTANISVLGVSNDSGFVDTLTFDIGVSKSDNVSITRWNTSFVNFSINVTNNGDFVLHNVTVNDTLGVNYTFISSNYGTYPTFTLGILNASETKQLWINVNTSYYNPSEILMNGTSIWNNITVACDEIVNTTASSYMFVGAQTDIILIRYLPSSTDTSDLSTTIFTILGVAVVLFTLLLIVYLYYSKQEGNY